MCVLDICVGAESVVRCGYEATHLYEDNKWVS